MDGNAGPSAGMNSNTWEERGLRAAILAGDEAAWRALYDRCFAPLYRYVYCRAGREPHRTEEVVQECWMVAIRRVRSFDPDRGSFEAWLRGIADKVLLNQRRRWRRRDWTEMTMQEPEAALGPQCSPGEQAAVTDAVGAAMAALPEGYQDVLRAKYREGRSVIEIAAARNQTAKAVESLLSRARAAFRSEYRRLTGEA